ncbi:WYL domain-containing protein [Arenibacter sp. F20364]|uniref:WYL domain-containing protein n=1 Tax=Arenibacter sp. F20364 TaxID=2926415 RepID=UPI0032B18B6B
MQNALTNYRLVKIQDIDREETATNILIGPFALVSGENWFLIEWCHLRKEFRFFQLDKFKK